MCSINESEKKLEDGTSKQLFYASPNQGLGVFYAANDGRLIFVSSMAGQVTRCSPKEVIGEPWYRLLPAAVSQQIIEAFELWILNQPSDHFTQFYIDHTQMQCVELSIDKVYQHDELIGLVGVFSSRKLTDGDESHSKGLLSLIFDATSEAIVFFDRYRRVIAANTAFEQLVQKPTQSLLNKRLSCLQLEEVGFDQLLNIAKNIHTHGHWQGDLKCTFQHQDSRVMRWTLDATKDPEGKIINFFATLVDVTRYHAELQEMQFHAYHDALTRVLNRTGLEKSFSSLCEMAEKADKYILLAMLDLDDFKPVNDQYGHQVGDEVLQEFARRLLGIVESDDLVARLGGDEFVIIVYGAGGQEALGKLHKKLLESLKPPVILEDKAVEIVVGSSIGYSQFPEDGRDLYSLLHAADQSMYQAKKRDKPEVRTSVNRVDFTSKDSGF